MTGTAAQARPDLDPGTMLAETAAGAYGALPFYSPGRAKDSAGNVHPISPGFALTTVSARILTANRRYMWPICVIGNPITIDQLEFEVTIAVGASNARVGFATANENWQPTAMVVDSGNIATAVNGVKTFATAQTLQPGCYIGMFQPDAAIQIRFGRGVVLNQGLINGLGANAGATSYYVDAGGGALTAAAWTNPLVGTTGIETFAWMRVTDPSA